MKKYLNKAMSLSLASIMAVGMTGCGGGNTNTNATTVANNNTTTAQENTTQSTTEATTVKELTEGEKLAEKYNGFVETPMDLGGRTIRVLSTASSKYSLKNDDKGNPSREATSNEVLYIVDALDEIKKDYNCDFTFEQLKAKAMVEALLTAKAAGDTYCDILEFAVSDTYLEQIYSNNLCMPLEGENVSNIMGLYTNPWLQQSAFGNMFGHQYGVHFTIYNSPDFLRGVLAFNKDLANKYNVGDIYSMVKDKTWTFAKFQEICASIASQANGEVYPLMYNQEGIAIPMLVFANGGTFSENTASGYKYTALSDNTLEALNYIVDLAKKGYVHPESENRSTNETNFANGESVFMLTNYTTVKKFKQGTIDTEYEYGMVPAPLGPNGDGEYNSVTYTNALFHVSNGVEKPEQVAAVLVAMANRTSKDEDTIIEHELMNSLFDEESGEMVSLMMGNIKCDFSRTVSTARSAISSAVTSMLKKNKETEFTFSKTPKEALEEIEANVQAAFDSVVLQDGTTTAQ